MKSNPGRPMVFGAEHPA
jgi:hypothetical protein